jgi:hypothetical protein
MQEYKVSKSNYKIGMDIARVILGENEPQNFTDACAMVTHNKIRSPQPVKTQGV